MTKVSKNYLYTVSYHVLAAIVPIVTAPYLARVIGAAGSGVYAYYSSIAAYFILVTKLGTETYGSRAIAAVRYDREELAQTFSALLYLTAGLGCAMMLLYGWFVWKWADQAESVAAWPLMLELLAAGFEITWLYAGLEEFRITAVRSMAVKLINTACIFLFVREQSDLWKYVLILGVGKVIGAAALWVGVRKRTYLCRVPLKVVKGHFLSCVLLFLPTIAVSIYKHMDKILLGMTDTMDSVGLYAYSEKIPTLLLGFVGAMGTVMLPRVSGLLAQGKVKEANDSIEKTMLFILFLSCAMSFGLAGISRELAPLFFGKAFAASGDLMVLMALSMVFTSWACVIRDLYILPRRKDKLVICTVCIGALVNLTVDLLLIPKFSSMGAMIGLVCAEISIPVSQFLLLRKELNYRPLLKDTLPFLAAGILMFVLTRMIGRWMGCRVLTLCVQTAVGAVVYCGILLAFFRISRPDVLQKWHTDKKEEGYPL